MIRGLVLGAAALAAAAGCLCVAAEPALATRNVDCSLPNQSIQKEIDRVKNGETIFVTGDCVEAVDIPESLQNVTLDGQGAATLTAPTANDDAIIVRGRGTTIKGFTISGGLDGIFLFRGATATIRENVIEDNSEGIFLSQNCSASILSNTIRDNLNSGITLQESSSARIGFFFFTPQPPQSLNTITDNGGPGVHVTRGSTARIRVNDISDNGGDGVRVTEQSWAQVFDNTIDGNLNGINVSEGSGVNLAFPSDTPNSGTNTDYGVQCTVGGYVSGKLGALTGGTAQTNIVGGCIDNTSP